MNKKKLFRALVCFVVICCLIVNISPVRSKATSVVAGLTVAEVVGYLALIIGVPVGAVFIADTVEKVAAVGQEIIDVWIDEDAAAQGALEYAEDLTSNINGMWENGDGSGYDPRLGTKLARGLLAAIAAMVGVSIVDGAMNAEVEEEVEVPEGYAYYNSILCKSAASYSNYPYRAMFCDSSGMYRFIWSPYPIIAMSESSGYTFYGPSESGTCFYRYSTDDVPNWSSSTNSSTFGVGSRSFSVGLLWADHDVLGLDGNVDLYASEPVYVGTQTTPITLPGTYVGDIPAELQDPDLTEDERTEKILAPLPDQIDITKVIKSPETALQDVTAWQQQVVDGVKSLEQSVEDIKADLDDTVDPGGDPDPGEDSDTNIDDYALDLTDFFPFCIPFDIYEFLSIMDAEPEAPYMEFDVDLPIVDTVWHLVIDLSAWDPTAQLLRRLELLLFIVGLAMVTRNHYIRG